MSFIITTSPPAEIGEDGGTLVNYGPDSVYYRDEAPVTSILNDGSVAAGSSVTLAGVQFVVSAGRSAIDVFPAPPEIPPTIGGSGVTYFATDADLPASASGHPVVLVLEDSTALNGQGQAQATLRYWSGTDWRLLGLAGGGTVGGDFIEVDANLAGLQNGQALLWNDSIDIFRPGALA